MKTALISGASSGIGEVLAGKFAEAGYALVLVARTESKLQQLAQQFESEHGVQVWVEAMDLSKRGAAKKLAGRLAKQSIDIDVLVNNAGVLLPQRSSVRR